MNHRSEIVREILNAPPKWLTAWGTTVIFIGVSSLILVSIFMKLPDEIEAKVSINSTNPPREVPTRISGQLEKLFVVEKEEVKQGHLLGLIKSEANYEQVLETESLLKELEKLPLGDLVNYRLESNVDLGEMQVEYESLGQTIRDIKEAGNKTLTSKTVRMLENRIKSVELKQARARRDRSESSIQLRAYKKKGNGINNNDRQAMNNLQQKIDGYGRVILEFDGQIEGLRVEILDKSLGSKQASQRKFEDFRTALSLLQDKISRWRYRHLLLAPADGAVVFLEVYDEAQYIQAGEAAFAIKPAQGNIYARGKLQAEGAGKVQVGQEVIIKLSGYPFQEYGVLKGQVEKVFVIPKTKQTIIDIHLPKGLETTKNRELKFINGMEGRASIHTDNKPVIAWLFKQFL